MSKYKEQRDKLVYDLVDFALQFQKVNENITVKPEGINDYILLDKMAEVVLKRWTKLKESEDADKE